LLVSVGLSQHNIKEFEQRMKGLSQKDKDEQDRASALNSLESYADELSNMGEKKIVDPKLKEQFRKQCEEVLDWIDDNPTAKREECDEKRKLLEDLVDKYIVKGQDKDTKAKAVSASLLSAQTTDVQDQGKTKTNEMTNSQKLSVGSGYLRSPSPTMKQTEGYKTVKELEQELDGKGRIIKEMEQEKQKKQKEKEEKDVKDQDLSLRVQELDKNLQDQERLHKRELQSKDFVGCELVETVTSIALQKALQPKQ
jgi:hypothetical protein